MHEVSRPAAADDAITVIADAMYRRYGDEVLVFLRHLVGNDEDAADLQQDVFASAVRALRGGIPTPDAPRSWLFRLAHNRAVDHYRRRRFLRLFLRFDDVREEPRSESEDPRSETWDALDRLSASEREAIVLRYKWRFTSGEIGKLQGRSDGAVRALIARALARLSRELEVER